MIMHDSCIVVMFQQAFLLAKLPAFVLPGGKRGSSMTLSAGGGVALDFSDKSVIVTAVPLPRLSLPPHLCLNPGLEKRHRAIMSDDNTRCPVWWAFASAAAAAEDCEIRGFGG